MVIPLRRKGLRSLRIVALASPVSILVVNIALLYIARCLRPLSLPLSVLKTASLPVVPLAGLATVGRFGFARCLSPLPFMLPVGEAAPGLCLSFVPRLCTMSRLSPRNGFVSPLSEIAQWHKLRLSPQIAHPGPFAVSLSALVCCAVRSLSRLREIGLARRLPLAPLLSSYTRQCPVLAAVAR